MKNPLRGRPRPPLPLHLVVSRELTGAMRQLRVANGDHTAQTVDILNEAIAELYPDATDERTDYGRRSIPHLVSERYVSRMERGHHARLPVPAWLTTRSITDPTVVYGSRVPLWLVAAYDLAFGADGYLVDMYNWAVTLLADHEHDPPRLIRHLPGHIPDGEEFDYLAAPLTRSADLDGTVQDLLHAEVAVLRARRARPTDDSSWSPSVDDGSGSLGEGEEDLPEGMLVRGGSQFIARWVLHNTGTVPWRDRLLYGVGTASHGSTGLRTPPFVTVPDTEPGHAVELGVPLRAPDRPGTYRACLKMGWPNGVYCFPSTLLGIIVTIIVPPADLVAPATDWARR